MADIVITEKDAQELIKKLRAEAYEELKRIRGPKKHLDYLPTSIRIKYAAAREIKRLWEENARLREQNKELFDEVANAIHDLSIMSDCCTCAEGPAKTCSMREECGRERRLWCWKSETV